MADENNQIKLKRISDLDPLTELEPNSFTVVAVNGFNKKFDLSKVDLTEVNRELEQHSVRLDDLENDLDGNLKIKDIDENTLQLSDDGKLSVIGGGSGTSDVNRAYVDGEIGRVELEIDRVELLVDGKAETGHIHDDYALKNHDHDNVYLKEHQDISHKVDKVDGKGLSTEDFTTEEKRKLESLDLSTKADVNHDHNGIYAETGHKHDTEYAPKADFETLQQEIINARESTNPVGSYSTLDARLEAMDIRIAAASGGSGTIDLSTYQTKEDTNLRTTNQTVVGAINELKATIPTDYATQDELTEVSDKVGVLETSNTTLTGEVTTLKTTVEAIDTTYATKTELTDGLNAKVNSTDLHIVATSGDYDDLTNKPVIPSIDGLVKEETLTNELEPIKGAINELKPITDEVIAARTDANTTHDSLDARLDAMDAAISAASGTDMTLYATKQYVNEEDIKITNQIGDLATLNTTIKTSLVAAINELFGKSGLTILTQQEYDDLADKDATTLFYISDKQNMIINEKVINERNVNIKSMSIEPKIAEMGSTVSSIMVAFELDGEPETIKVNNVEATGTSHTLTGTFTADTDVVLDVTLNSGRVVTQQCELEFANGIYVGVSDSVVYDAALINSLEKVLSNHKSGEQFSLDVESYLYVINEGIEKSLVDVMGRDIVLDCTENAYVYYALPSRLGEPLLSVNGIIGGFMLANTIQFTNPSGFEEDYNIYRSEYHSLGTITLLAM